MFLSVILASIQIARSVQKINKPIIHIHFVNLYTFKVCINHQIEHIYNFCQEVRRIVEIIRNI